MVKLLVASQWLRPVGFEQGSLAFQKLLGWFRSSKLITHEPNAVPPTGLNKIK